VAIDLLSDQVGHHRRDAPGPHVRDLETVVAIDIVDHGRGGAVDRERSQDLAAAFTGTTGSTGHGIAWTPDESEVWADDGGNPYVHVFDMTVSPPIQTHLVRVTSTSPHWITFTIDGRFAYAAGPKGSGAPTDIIDTSSYQRIGVLAQSEDLLEVDIAGGRCSPSATSSAWDA
jgi:hypothetical protein